MNGQVVVVTGGTSGIGLAAAIAMAGLGATVHLVGRDADRARRASAEVEAAGSAPVHFDLVDLADPEAVVALGLRLAERYDRVDVARPQRGIAFPRVQGRRPLGWKRTVATQVLGPYVLTATLWRRCCGAARRRPS